jgi:hypothetical protein
MACEKKQIVSTLFFEAKADPYRTTKQNQNPTFVSVLLSYDRPFWSAELHHLFTGI